MPPEHPWTAAEVPRRAGQPPDKWGREELTEADLDFVRRLGSGELVVFKVQLPGGRTATRHWRQLGTKVVVVDWIDQIDVLSDPLPLPWLER
jgi:hypothetical protein